MLKQSLTALALTALVSTPALADTERDAWCKEIYELSAVVMEKRQQGAPMPMLIELIEDSEDSDLFRSIIIGAYEIPRFSTEGYQREETSKFANEIYRMCLTH